MKERGADSKDLDVSQLRRRLAEAEEREERLRTALEAAGAGTWELELATGRELWSEQLYRLYGLSPETPTPSYRTWLDLVHPDERERLDRKSKEIIENGRQEFSDEFRITHPERGVRWMLSRGRVIRNAEGEATHMTGTVLDITERKRAEEALLESRRGEKARATELEAVMAAVPAVVWIAHDPAARRMTGSRASYEFLRIPWGGNLSKSAPQDAPEHFRVFQDGLELAPDELPIQRAARGEEVRDFEEKVVFDDGTFRYLFGHATPLYDVDGNVRGAVGAFIDITDRKRIEEELASARDELEQRVEERTAQLRASNKELETFAYSVSHDLRAPLRGIDGFSQALLEDYGERLDETGKRYLERVRGAANRMGELIDDLLNLSRLSRGEMHRREVNLGVIAARLAEDLKEAAPNRRIVFEIAQDVTALGDERLLTIALENLLDNAWKFTREREEAHITFGVDGSAELKVYFVKDNGAGFDMAYADKLFIPFQRLHSPDRFDGAGIGLATVQRIIHRHGGRIWAEAAVGEGATFYFTLPKSGSQYLGE